MFQKKKKPKPKSKANFGSLLHPLPAVQPGQRPAPLLAPRAGSCPGACEAALPTRDAAARRAGQFSRTPCHALPKSRPWQGVSFHTPPPGEAERQEPDGGPGCWRGVPVEARRGAGASGLSHPGLREKGNAKGRHSFSSFFFF